MLVNEVHQDLHQFVIERDEDVVQRRLIQEFRLVDLDLFDLVGVHAFDDRGQQLEVVVRGLIEEERVIVVLGQNDRGEVQRLNGERREWRVGVEIRWRGEGGRGRGAGEFQRVGYQFEKIGEDGNETDAFWGRFHEHVGGGRGW